MFQPADPLFGNGKEQFAISDKTRRRVVGLRVVQTKNDHFSFRTLKLRRPSTTSLSGRVLGGHWRERRGNSGGRISTSSNHPTALVKHRIGFVHAFLSAFPLPRSTTCHKNHLFRLLVLCSALSIHAKSRSAASILHK
jgi:hypothetical protein